MNEFQEEIPPGEDLKEPENDNYPKTDWSLRDVLESTPESVNNKFSVFTPCSSVFGGEMQVDLGENDNSIIFLTKSAQLVNRSRAGDFGGFEFNATEDNGRITEEYDNGFVRLIISDIPESEERSVVINFRRRSLAPVDIKTLGLEGILVNHDLPETTSPEYAGRIIEDRKISVGRREIAVEKKIEGGNLKDLFEEPVDDKMLVFHGTSLSDALLILRMGLFSPSGPVEYNPILSGAPDGMAAKLARDEWGGYERADPSGYGAIIVFRADEEDLVISSDLGPRHEKLYHPAKRIDDDNERYRLQRGAKRNLPTNNPRYLPPDRIEKIVLVKQSSRNSDQRS